MSKGHVNNKLVIKKDEKLRASICVEGGNKHLVSCQPVIHPGYLKPRQTSEINIAGLQFLVMNDFRNK